MTFLDLQIDNHVNRKNHIGQTITKLHEAYHAVRPVFLTSNTGNPKIIYFVHLTL
jgi:hypothetical protein